MFAQNQPAKFQFAKFHPRILECVRGYNGAIFARDAMAGITVGIVALSLCIGLGIASGVTPEAGLYAGIIGGFCVAAFGGSRVQIGGPAGAFVGLMALMFAKYAVADVLLCIMIAGVILFLMGLLKIGSFIRFVPQPVTAGFTCGIAITILTTQIRPFLGLTLSGREPAEFFQKIGALWDSLPTVNWTTLLIGAILLATQMCWPAKWNRHVPASIVVVLLGLVFVGITHIPFFSEVSFLKIETIDTVFGAGGRDAIPRGLPTFAFPSFDWAKINELISPAFTIALLCALESLLSAVVADGLIDDRHDSNQELMGQGIANFVAPLFGGIAVTGVIARTATNIRSGGKTPVAGIIHAVFLLVVLLVAAPLVVHIPLVSLAVVLVVVALRMGEWEEFVRLRKRDFGDAAVFLTTFSLTVCFDLTVAVKIGMLLAAVLFVKRVADSTKVNAMSGDAISLEHGEKIALPAGVIVYRMFGALMFGAADRIDAILRRELRETKIVILNMTAVPAMDATAIDRLENLHSKLARHKRKLLICGAHSHCYSLMKRDGFLTLIGIENVMPDLPASLERAKILLAEMNKNDTGAIS